MKLSAPMQLLTLVWENKQKATKHSWLKINQITHADIKAAKKAAK